MARLAALALFASAALSAPDAIVADDACLESRPSMSLLQFAAGAQKRTGAAAPVPVAAAAQRLQEATAAKGDGEGGIQAAETFATEISRKLLAEAASPGDDGDFAKDDLMSAAMSVVELGDNIMAEAPSSSSAELPLSEPELVAMFAKAMSVLTLEQAAEAKATLTKILSESPAEARLAMAQLDSMQVLLSQYGSRAASLGNVLGAKRSVIEIGKKLVAEGGLFGSALATAELGEELAAKVPSSGEQKEPSLTDFQQVVEHTMGVQAQMLMNSIIQAVDELTPEQTHEGHQRIQKILDSNPEGSAREELISVCEEYLGVEVVMAMRKIRGMLPPDVKAPGLFYLFD